MPNSSSSSTTNLAEIGAHLMGGKLKSKKALAGGCISECLQITLADGREAVVKNGPMPHAEAEMLQAIGASGAPAPKVIAANEQALVMEVLPSDGNLGGPGTWKSFGRALAQLHSTIGQPGQYGWSTNFAYCDAMPFSNEWTNNWPEFWAERRLRPHIGHVPKEIGHRLGRLCADLKNLLPANPRPALLHGDLWSGNVLFDGKSGKFSGFIDPACYYGHAEVDFGMLELFSKPNKEFYEAYGPLEEGHYKRQPIYQLWPAIVHLRLFGGSYRQMVEGLLDKTGF